jgi:hypothetical protein
MPRIRVILRIAIMAAVLAVVGASAGVAYGAYNHMGEIDSGYFLSVHPNATGTKLDSCTLCHSGGMQGTKYVGSCQWCHFKYGYDSSGDILATLNSYGLAYLNAGRSSAAVSAIEGLDSDGDGYSNADEIASVRFPGDPNDDPTKVTAPARIYDLAQIEAMPALTQFMLMNTSKSGDFYGTYTGVPLEYVLGAAGILPAATEVNVFAADGFSTYHPLDPTPGLYHVRGNYPDTTFFYNVEADKALTSYGWCDYSAASVAGRANGDPISGLKMLLAYKYEGEYLVPGRMGADNRLTPDSEGPFRTVPPQTVAGPPDQSSTSPTQGVIWPYNKTWDHNAGFASKCATIIKVGPLPEGTTDINVLEAGWNYVDQGKIVVYGAIDPIPTVREKLRTLARSVAELDASAFRGKSRLERFARRLGLLGEIWAVDKMLTKGKIDGAVRTINRSLLPKVDGWVLRGRADSDDWIVESQAQRTVYWSLSEMLTLLAIDT